MSSQEKIALKTYEPFVAEMAAKHEVDAFIVWNILDHFTRRAPSEREKAIEDIAAERQRQKSVEGWTPEHDDEHAKGEMGLAASCYADPRLGPLYDNPNGTCAPPSWPWDASWWKPKDRRRDLVRAAALLVAEIERLDRAALGDS